MGRLSPLLFVAAAAAAAILAASFGCSESPPTPVSAPKTPTVAEGASSAQAASSASSASADEPDKDAKKALDGAPSSPKAAENAAAAMTAPAEAAGARIYSKARFAWIYPAARRTNAWLGYVSLGGSAPLRGGSVEKARIMGGPGCDAWYAVEPRGFMCAGSAASLDAQDPAVVALRKDAPDVSSPWPYHYGESTGAPRYPGIPTPVEQSRTEWDLTDHMALVERAKTATSKEEVAAIDKSLVGVDLKLSGVPAPELFAFGPLVREGRKSIAIGSTVAYTREFDVGGRAFLLTADQAVIPKDRVKPYPRSEFKGVELGGDVSLPIAFFRKKERPKYVKGADGTIAPSGEMFPVRSYVALTGDEVTQGEQRFLVTRDPSVFVSADDATAIKAATKTPFNSATRKPGGRQTWLDVSIMSGWLVAYEDLKPVFATLISPGRGGVPVPGRDALATASTPVGRFRIDGKFVTATMVSSTDENVVHTEVQYIQNFSGPHALHAAYWHDAWGERKSGGCVNLSPIDAKRLFAWTDPQVPDGWHGLRSTADFGNATEVVLHR